MISLILSTYSGSFTICIFPAEPSNTKNILPVSEILRARDILRIRYPYPHSMTSEELRSS